MRTAVTAAPQSAAFFSGRPMAFPNWRRPVSVPNFPDGKIEAGMQWWLDAALGPRLS